MTRLYFVIAFCVFVVIGGVWGAQELGKRAIAKDLIAARSERDKTDDWADVTCNYARSSYRVYDAHTGKLLPRDKWGVECKTFVKDMRDRVDGEAQRLSEALQTQQTELNNKYAVDLAAARRNSTRQSNSLKNLEAADAAITNGHYPPEWWIALGDTLGLRSKPEASVSSEPRSGSPSGEGTAAR